MGWWQLSWVTACALVLGACHKEPPRAASPDADGSKADAGVELPDAGAYAAAPPVAICDGDAGVRLSMMSLADPGRMEQGSRVMYENGTHFLFVDGTCRFWVQSASHRWAGVRTGALDAAGEAALTSRVRYADWASLAGRWTTSGNGTFDMPSLLFWRDMQPAEAVLCLSGCMGTGLPYELEAAAAALAPAVEALWDAGVHVPGAVRYQVIRTGVRHEALPWFAWQVPGVQLDDVALVPSSDPTALGVPGRYAEGEAAEALRTLRARHVASMGPNGYLDPSIPIRSADGGAYELFLRDALPFENDAGVVRPGAQGL